MGAITIDLYERASGVPDALVVRGVEIGFALLDAGDYRLANGVLVERKTVPDLHLSIERGRYWRQIGALRRAARLPYLLIEGTDLDLEVGSVGAAAIRAWGSVHGVGPARVEALRRARTNRFSQGEKWQRPAAHPPS